MRALRSSEQHKVRSAATGAVDLVALEMSGEARLGEEWILERKS